MSDKSNESSLHTKITKLGISMNELIIFFRQKCKVCGHQRIMHDERGKCEGVMNKPCNYGCDKYNPE